MQESFIFKPDKLDPTKKLSYSIPSQEVNIPSKGVNLSGVYFKIPNPKGLIFFLHGNAGNLEDQENAAKFYNASGFDFFSFDYRGYGKTGSEIVSEDQFSEDIQTTYNFVKKDYLEKDITVIGYSIGTGPAARLTYENNPSKLVLIAPYYSLSEIAIRDYKIIPSFLLKYKFDTYLFVEKIKNRILLIHGTMDSVLPFEGSRKLSKLLSSDDKFLKLENQGHNDLEENSQFRTSIRDFLKN